jgi:hypothetical protein
MSISRPKISRIARMAIQRAVFKVVMWNYHAGALALCACASVPAWSQQFCTPDHVDVPKEQVRATANFLANLARSPGSLRAELARVLNSAREELTQATPPGDACSSPCGVAGPIRVLLSIVPSKFHSSYPGSDRCEEQLAETKNQPLTFGPHHARQQDELANWLVDVAQGRGQDGAALYQKCSGRCSPSYFMDASQDGDGFVATLRVVCGHARDKNDNTYIVSSGYRWACAAVQ